ncbi:hypothetical protein [Bradyrhizobium sp. LB11.1]|uniref:hypothetical protein n=1 Tax=Bradyrhizobium sp. LB11.1 TaxID=3156326 RepID=UPI0033992343
MTVILRSLGINKSTFDAQLRRRPDLRARLDAAKPLTGQALVCAKFDDILTAIRNGATAEGAVESFGGTGVSFFKVVKSDQALHQRFVAATADRENGDNARGKAASGRFSEADFERAIEALRAAPKIGFARVLVDGLPTPFLVLDKAKRDPEFHARLVEVVGERAKRRAGLKKQPPRVYAEGLLRQACLALDLYRSADGAAAGLDPEDRDDVASEIVLAVLEGEITEQEIRTKGRRLGRRRVFGEQAWASSLDATAHDTSNAETLGERLASPCGIIFY